VERRRTGAHEHAREIFTDDTACEGSGVTNAGALDTKPGVFGGARAVPQKGNVKWPPWRDGERRAGPRTRVNRSWHPGWNRGMLVPAPRRRECQRSEVLVMAPPARKTGAGGRYPRRRETSCTGVGTPVPSQGRPPKPHRPKRAMRIAPPPIAGFRQRELPWAPRGTPHRTMMRWKRRRAIGRTIGGSWSTEAIDHGRARARAGVAL